MENYSEIKYLEAKRKVKQLKGFYTHATVYVLVNLFLIARKIYHGKSIFDIDIYWTALFWGIGLLVHGSSFFLPHFFLGKDWEEKKIRDLMDEELKK